MSELSKACFSISFSRQVEIVHAIYFCLRFAAGDLRLFVSRLRERRCLAIRRSSPPEASASLPAALSPRPATTLLELPDESLHPICPWKKPSMAFFHLGNTQKRQGFSGLPIAASCGRRLYPQSGIYLFRSPAAGDACWQPTAGCGRRSAATVAAATGTDADSRAGRAGRRR